MEINDAAPQGLFLQDALEKCFCTCVATWQHCCKASFNKLRRDASRSKSAAPRTVTLKADTVTAQEASHSVQTSHCPQPGWRGPRQAKAGPRIFPEGAPLEDSVCPTVASLKLWTATKPTAPLCFQRLASFVERWVSWKSAGHSTAQAAGWRDLPRAERQQALH